jgi:hypothetical protein
MLGLGANPLGAATTGVVALGAAMVALGAAVSGVVISAIVKFAKSQDDTAFAVESLKTRLEELHVAFGKAMVGAGDTAGVFQNLELVVIDMTEEIAQSSSGLHWAFVSSVELMEIGVQHFLNVYGTAFEHAASVADTLRIAWFLLRQGLSEMFDALDKMLSRLAELSGVDFFGRIADNVRRLSMEMESNAPVLWSRKVDTATASLKDYAARIAQALLGTQDMNDELIAMKSAQKAKRIFDKANRDFAKRTGGRGGGGRRKGPQVPAWMQIEIDKADLMYETWKEETTQAENRPLGAMADTMATSLGATMPIITAQVAALKAEIDALKAAAAASDKIFTDLANGGISLAWESVAGMTQALIEGGDAMQAFGAGLLASLGDLLTQAGMAFVMMGTGVENIKLGITAPGALIAIGVGMLALGGALKGFATRAQPGGGGGGGDGGKTAQALQRFGRQLFDRQMGQESKNVMINIEGRQMRGYVLDVASDGLRTGSIPLTPVRRR